VCYEVESVVVYLGCFQFGEIDSIRISLRYDWAHLTLQFRLLTVHCIALERQVLLSDDTLSPIGIH